MIDLVAIDYAFPMLQAESLFLPAMTTICRRKNVGLTLVCNKRFSRVDEVCFVSDNVLFARRENDMDSDKCKLYLEKNAFGRNYNSRVFQFEINRGDINNGKILDQKCSEEICTTKDFWRQAWNIKNEVTVSETEKKEE